MKQWESPLYRFEIKEASFKRLVDEVLARIPSAVVKEFPEFAILQGPQPERILAHGSENATYDVDKINALGLSTDAKIGVIAHELAHIFLGHIDANWSDEELQTLEDEANDKAAEWGFKKEIEALHEALTRLAFCA